MKIIVPVFLMLFFICSQSMAQENRYFSPIINEIGSLENNRDPKCAATAARLENFMYGTPLVEEARQAKIYFERAFVKELWLAFSQRDLSNGIDSIEVLKEVEQNWFTYSTIQTGIEVKFSKGNHLILKSNDIRQYGNVAFSLRTILAVQQSFLFEDQPLARLDGHVIEYLKKSLDIASLSVLQLADERSRKEYHQMVLKEDIIFAVFQLYPELNFYKSENKNQLNRSQEQASMLRDIIAQKLEAYDQYNHINQSVFLRNLQVYFTKIPWPKDVAVSDSLKIYFTESMVQFSKDILQISQSMSLKENKVIIEYIDAYKAIQVYMPHEINDFEDVVYFPNLKEESVTIESYDLDAFRDSGLHWKYLLAALKDSTLRLGISPDPHALEMIVEGIAQFAILYLRLGGEDAISHGQSVLMIKNLENALHQIQDKINHQIAGRNQVKINNIVSSREISEVTNMPLFEEVTNEYRIDFQHRNSDWLNRLIRSYVIKEDEQLARLAIPPAFGGGGVAAADIDNDGWDDILLLGGVGNKLFKNDGGKGFVDITEISGIALPLVAGSYGEPRQPIIADFDNDGLQDIFITYVNAPHRLYKNIGDGKFEDVSERAGLGGVGLIGGPATALDFDKDGLLDLYIGYFGNYLEGQLPTLKRNNDNGSPNKLFKNKGRFIFDDVSSNAAIENVGWTQAVGHSDFNGDGWQDLIVGNDFGINSYYQNLHNGSFKDISSILGTNKPSYTMNVGITDLNKDFLPDFYISNIVVMEKDDKYVLPNENTVAHFDINSLKTMRVMEANDLFLSTRNDSGEVKYDVSNFVDRGYGNTGWSWDADFFDFDLDGDDDLYCVTGMNPYSVYSRESEYYNGNDSDGMQVSFAESHEDKNVLFRNENGKLNIVDEFSGLDYSGTSRSAAFFDFDHDGDLDVIVNDYQGRAKFFQNNADINRKNWTTIHLSSNKKTVTKDAIGAVIIITTPDGNRQWREIHSTTGYLSVHTKNQSFGLGKNEKFDLKVRWPDGYIQMEKDLAKNQFYKFIEPY